MYILILGQSTSFAVDRKRLRIKTGRESFPVEEIFYESEGTSSIIHSF